MGSYKTLQINTDGGSRGNPGPSAVGVFASSEGSEVFSLSEYIGLTTNNEAEYKAVIFALEYLVENNTTALNVLFVLDSELVVKQLNGQYKVKQPHLQKLKATIFAHIENLKKNKQIEQLTFQHILREKNKQADQLVNQALDSQK